MKKLTIILVLIATSAYGEIYRWTDSKGTTHFTNSIHEIPERYRAKAKTVNLGIPEHNTDQQQPPQATPVVVQPQQSAVPAFATPLLQPTNPAPRTDDTRARARRARRLSEDE
jgi:hypothetical protein